MVPREKTADASRHAQAVEQVRQIAQFRGARATVSGGSRPHVTVTLDVSDSNRDVGAMLSAIESATRGQFDRGREFPGNITEWTLKSKDIVVSVRVTVV